MNTPIKRLFICATSVMALASCGGGNDVASGGAGTGVTSASAVSAGGPNGAVSTSATSTKAAMDRVGNSFATVPAGSMLRVAYIDATASGGLASIPATGYSTPDILIYAFVSTAGLASQTLDTYLINAIKAGASLQGPGKKTFISIGGEYGASISFANVNSIVSNVSAGITALNATLPKANQVVGVDLDLESSQDAATITALAAGFKQTLGKTFLVSVAPQPVSISGPGGSIDPSNPTNLGLSSTGFSNQYGQAIASGNVDYIFAQAYNTPNFTIGGCNETQLCFIGQLATAFNNAQKASCSGSSGTPLCIPSNTQYAIGLPSSRAGVGINSASIWQPESGAYDYSSQLSALATTINAALPILQKNNNNGIMVWSQDTDYDPAIGYGDQYACVGGFNSAIFGSTLAMNCPQPTPPPGAVSPFTLTIVNNTPNYIGIGMQDQTYYYRFAGAGDIAVPPNSTVTSGTTTSNQKSISTALNTLMANGADNIMRVTYNKFTQGQNVYTNSGTDGSYDGTLCQCNSMPTCNNVLTQFMPNTTRTITLNANLSCTVQ
jgi:Glycosyl hydrolases family 18